jgi:hypothetical protein
MDTLVVPFALLRRLLVGSVFGGRRPPLLEVGRRATNGDTEWLARDLFVPGDADGRTGRPDRLFEVRIAADNRDFPREKSVPAQYAGGLTLAADRPHLPVAGVAWCQGSSRSLHSVRLVGPGMFHIPLSADARAEEQRRVLPFSTPAQQYWSRTIGALGGAAAWRRLVRLRTTVVGCGRTGSIAASMLRRIGVSDITLIDPDRIEAHNCGEMDLVDGTDVSEPKVAALARRLTRLDVPVPGHVTAVPHAIDHADAVAAVKQAEIVVTAVDSDAARLSAALLSTLYHKVLLDVGAGVLLGQGTRRARATPAGAGAEVAWPARRVMGADIRLVVPGDGCLLCRGGLTNYTQALRDLWRGRTANDVRRIGSERRVGSLRSLNQLAVATGMRLLEDLVTGYVTSTTWVRIEFDERGWPSVDVPEAADRACDVCRQRGLGDDAL